MATPPNQRIKSLEEENAELRRQLDEAIAQQQAAAEVLGVINSSPGDLAPVFDAMLEKARALGGAAFGTFMLREGERFFAGAVHGAVPEPFARLLREGFVPSPASPVGRLRAGEPFVHIPDLAATLPAAADDPVPRTAVEVGGVRTLLMVPLIQDSQLVGLFTNFRQEVRPFTDKQIALLRNFAAQAVIAMENARLITETREALEQQTATAEVLQVINSSPGDLKPVFDAMLERAVRLCEFDFSTLWTFDGSAFHPVARHGVPERFWQLMQHHTPPAFARVLAGERLVYIPDLQQVSAYMETQFARGVRELGLDNPRSLLIVALRKEEAVVGAIVAYRHEIRAFADKQIALLQNFAAQAVIAMENARLMTETRDALEQQTATAEVLQVINSSPGDLAPVFDAMLEKATALCEATFGTLWTYDGEYMRAAAVLGATPQYTEFLRAGPHQPSPIAHQPLLRGAPVVHIPDVADHEGYHSGLALPNALVDLGGVRTLLAVPLRRDAQLLGVFSIYRDEVRPFSDKQIALLQNFAAQAVIAMENARLITETREALDQQTATAEVLGLINSSPGELAPVFDAMLERSLRLCGAAFGNLLTYDGQNFNAVAGVYSDISSGQRELTRPPFRPEPGGALDRLVRGENLIYAEEVRAEISYEISPPFRELVDAGDYHTIVHVALRKEDSLLGAIVIFFKEIQKLTDKQIAVLQNFAAQAVIAMENARLITETREALEQQTATAEVLGVINASPGDLTPVFDAMLERAVRLSDFDFAVLWTYDGASFRAQASHAAPPAYADFLAKRAAPVAPGTAFAHLLAGADIAQFDDVGLDDPGAPYGPTHPLVALGGARTYLAVALRKEGRLFGVISAFRQEVKAFSEKQIAVLQNFAAQAVIAMENARLLGELRQRTDEVAELNRGLEARVAAQVDELGRVGNLKRFLPPQVAEVVVSQGNERILESHRREIVVVFCDVRGYTAFSETAEPEEVIEFLGEYHAALGPLITQFEGTLSHFLGDGLMVFFNDPMPCPDPAERAVKMAVAMREAARGLVAAWRRRGHQMGFGAGVAQGYATLGQIGFADRSDYTAIGTVCNLAARLCGEAQDGQILLARRVAVAVEDGFVLEELGSLALKGLTQPVAAFNVVGTAGMAEAASD